jgi:hypothetical protein
MKANQSLDLETYREAIEILRIGSRAVRKAQEENLRLGVPNVYSHNGSWYYELPNARLTTVDPLEYPDS